MADELRSTSDLRLDELFDGRYVLKKLVGTGAMGSVYKARDTVLERSVAIKVIESLGEGSEAQQNLLTEARLAGSLTHTNIVSVHDVGMVELAADMKEHPYLVMEFVDGSSLLEYEPSGMDELIGIATGIARGLTNAHANGILHRDLKPENVVINQDGVPKLTDFGLARTASSRLSLDGTISGTVFYMAPEAALAQVVDERSDLYAFGVLLYEKATGELPFYDEEPLAVISQHLHSVPIPPIAINEAIPAQLSALIIDLLQKEPEMRPPNAREVLNRLEHLDLHEETQSYSAEIAVLERIARGKHIGRERELVFAKTVWLGAQERNGSTLLVTGEPGIGKSRFLRELATLSRISGGSYLVGESYEEGGISYGAISQIVQELLPWIQENDSVLPEYVISDLATLAPAVSDAFPDAPPSDYDDGHSKQQRVFDSFLLLVRVYAAKRPLLLAIEDLQWSDQATLSLFRHVSRNLKGVRCMMVATFREQHLDRANRLSRVTSELNRSRVASRIKLHRFDYENTKKLLESLFGQEVSTEFAEAIYDDTEGNPFYIEEVSKGLIDSGDLYYEEERWQRPEMSEFEVPRSIRVTIQGRIAQLPDSVQETLRLASMIGRSFDYGLLLRLSGQDEAELIELLEVAEQAQLIEARQASTGVSFRFGHALVAATLRGELNLVKKRRLHRRVAASLQEMGSEDFSLMAEHHELGGEPAKQFKMLIRAAASSNDRAAYADADDSARDALEIAIELADSQMRFEASEMLARIHENTDQHSLVVESVRNAVEAWESMPAEERSDEDGLRIYRFGAELRRFGVYMEESLEYVQHALEMAERLDRTELRAELLVARSVNQFWMLPSESIDLEAAVADGEMALSLADEDDVDLQSRALDAISAAYFSSGIVDTAREVHQKRAKLFDRMDRLERKDFLWVGIEHVRHLGRYGEAEAESKVLFELVKDSSPRWQWFAVGQQFHIFERWGKVQRLRDWLTGSIELQRGFQLRYGGNGGLARELERMEILYRLLMGEQLGDEDDRNNAPSHTDGSVLAMRWRMSSLLCAVTISCELGQLEHAGRLIDECPTPDDRVTEENMARAKEHLSVFRGGSGLRDGLVESVERKRGSWDRPELARRLWLLGELMLREAEVEHSARILREAIDRYEDMGVDFYPSICMRSLAEALALQGKRDEAGIAISRAIDGFERVGAIHSVGKSRELIKKYAL